MSKCIFSGQRPVNKYLFIFFIFKSFLLQLNVAVRRVGMSGGGVERNCTTKLFRVMIIFFLVIFVFMFNVFFCMRCGRRIGKCEIFATCLCVRASARACFCVCGEKIGRILMGLVNFLADKKFRPFIRVSLVKNIARRRTTIFQHPR